MITEKLQMGDIETKVVIYKGTNLVAHRMRNDTGPQFTLKELQHIVKCWNAFPDLLNSLKSFVDDEVCHFDHHGYCQTHSVTKPCRTQTARDIIGKITEAE